MSLNWSWNEKCGEAVFEQHDKEFTVNLYQGNAYLIFLYEYKDKETGHDMYNLWTFWADKTHAKRCLGLEKGYENLYSDARDKLKKIRINKAKCSKASEIVGLLVKAFDDLVIEIYSE